jgi:4-hydroxybenzoate polyprenyltransferase
LLLGGIGLGATWSRSSLLVALLLGATILAYDGGVKRTRLGPFCMGACRSLNFLLGLSVAAAPAGLALVVGAYVTALTYLARDEVGGNRIERARVGLVGLAALGSAVGGLLYRTRSGPGGWIAFTITCALGAWLWAPLWRTPDGPNTRRAVGGGILLIPMVDATVVAAQGIPLGAAAVASLALPAMVLRRWFSPT